MTSLSWDLTFLWPFSSKVLCKLKKYLSWEKVFLSFLMRRACWLQYSFCHPMSLCFFWKGSSQSYEQKSNVGSPVHSGLQEDLSVESCAFLPVSVWGYFQLNLYFHLSTAKGGFLRESEKTDKRTAKDMKLPLDKLEIWFFCFLLRALLWTC